MLAILQFLAFALSSNWDAELARLKVLQADGPEALEALEYAPPSLLATEAGRRITADAQLLAAAERLADDAASGVLTVWMSCQRPRIRCSERDWRTRVFSSGSSTTVAVPNTMAER